MVFCFEEEASLMRIEGCTVEPTSFFSLLDFILLGMLQRDQNSGKHLLFALQ